MRIAAVTLPRPAAEAEALVRRFKTRDPFRIAEGLGITVVLLDTLTHLRGFYKTVLRNSYLFLNSALSEEERRVVCAHELGHARLHREVGGALRLADGGDGRREYEANLFAAALLCPGHEIAPLLLSGRSATEVAALLGVDENLVALAVSLLPHGEGQAPTYDHLFLASAPSGER